MPIPIRMTAKKHDTTTYRHERGQISGEGARGREAEAVARDSMAVGTAGVEQLGKGWAEASGVTVSALEAGVLAGEAEEDWRRSPTRT